MAYDLGTLGSDGYYSPDDKLLFPLHDQIFSDVFNGSIQMKQREEMLINAAGGISDKGFIAVLEKTIATHAHCIILLGTTSSSVESSASVYFSLHPSNTCALSALKIFLMITKLNSQLLIYQINFFLLDHTVVINTSVKFCAAVFSYMHLLLTKNCYILYRLFILHLNQNSQAVKKECNPQKGQGEKRCEIQGDGQEMAVMVG